MEESSNGSDNGRLEEIVRRCFRQWSGKTAVSILSYGSHQLPIYFER